jgi:hypothetical protein
MAGGSPRGGDGSPRATSRRHRVAQGGWWADTGAPSPLSPSPLQVQRRVSELLGAAAGGCTAVCGDKPIDVHPATPKRFDVNPLPRAVQVRLASPTFALPSAFGRSASQAAPVLGAVPLPVNCAPLMASCPNHEHDVALRSHVCFSRDRSIRSSQSSRTGISLPRVGPPQQAPPLSCPLTRLPHSNSNSPL